MYACACAGTSLELCKYEHVCLCDGEQARTSMGLFASMLAWVCLLNRRSMRIRTSVFTLVQTCICTHVCVCAGAWA